MKKNENRERMNAALSAAKNTVLFVEKAEKAGRFIKKYVMPVFTVVFAVFAYAVYDVNLGEERKKIRL